jgi:hypothetical protein
MPGSPSARLKLRGSGGDIHQRQRRVADKAPFVLRAEPGEAVVEKPTEPKGDVDGSDSIPQKEPCSDSALVVTPWPGGTIRTPDAVYHANPAEEAWAVPRPGHGTTG